MNKKDLAFGIYAALRSPVDSGEKDLGNIAMRAWGYLGGVLKRYADDGDKDARRAYEQYCITFERGTGGDQR